MEHLIVTVLGQDRLGIADKLTEIAASSHCNIVDCKMFTMGEEFTANMHLSGTWNAVAKAENLLDHLEKQTKIQTLRARSKIVSYPKDMLPYTIYITAKDQVGMSHKISNFFAEENISITEFYSESRPARKSGAQIMSLAMYINVSVEVNISDLRERFAIFCDNYNLDGVMEAEKGL